ncbi:uncharacterized protein LOC142663415 [Rhinoderma darwinii]|uniref:uncharacterized protein LOC142663415 n=1 Tax=Rhinoderma darwinii TaxID=43563 RepID=UPI003F662A9C
MEQDKSEITEQILNLTLEILYLLTGEDYIIVKKPGGQTTRNHRLQVVEGFCRNLGNVLLPPPHSVTTKEDNDEKILDLTHQIIELLTGEVPIRCQDVAVYFSMEEWEYIEGHKDLYKDVMMEDHRDRTPQGKRDLYKEVMMEDHRNRTLPGKKDLYKDIMMEDHRDRTSPGKRDLYKDIMVEDHRNRTSPDDSICKNSLLHNVRSDLVNEDDVAMDTESRTESLKRHNPRDRQQISCGNATERISTYENGSISDAGHRRYTPVHIKEEPCDGTNDGGNLANTATHSDVQLQSIRIKEEPYSCYGDILTDSNFFTPTDHTQHHPYPHIIEESISCGGQNLTQTNIYTSSDPSQHPTIPNMEEPFSRDRGNPTDSDIYRPTDHTQRYPHIMKELVSSNKADLSDTNVRSFTGHTQPIRIKEEPHSCEKEHIDTKKRRYPTRNSSSTLVKQREPASRTGRKRKNLKNTLKTSTLSEPPETDVDNETSNSSSVYSVRQSANAMEILYHCPSCQKGFFSNLDLARHQVIHTVDKLFICSLCGKSFTEMSFLVKHQVIHTDLKLCVCPVCGGCFYSETSLTKHQKSHSVALYCSTCGRCFFDKTELEKHKRKHTGGRPYSCHVCGKQCIAKSVLNKHVLTHTPAELKSK